MERLNKIKISDATLKPLDLENKWMLISAEKDGIANSMTDSWGSFGGNVGQGSRFCHYTSTEI